MIKTSTVFTFQSLTLRSASGAQLQLVATSEVVNLCLRPLNLLSIRKTVLVAAALSSLVTLSAHHQVQAEMISAVADLTTPTATENTFDVTVDVLLNSDSQVITYEGVVRLEMEIDFSDFAAPVVQTLDFVGVMGDIQHSDATFTVALGTADFTSVRGRIETLPGNSPAPVTGGTTFSTGDHEIIAWMGTIDITPIVGSPLQINLMNDTFRRTLGGVNDATINLTLNNVAAGLATYDLELFTPLQMVTILTGNPTIDDAITITIDGDLVARTQINRPIPEPSTAAMLAGFALLAAACSHRSNVPRS
jgi:hypothetical protein